MDITRTILYEEVRGYVTPAYKGQLYFSVSENETLYSIIFVPDDNYPVKVDTDIVVAARILDDRVLIEKDTLTSHFIKSC